MGMHSARRTGSMTTVAGRGLFTATAAFALIGGGTGMAFAGEAPSSHGHESSHGEAEHSGEHQNDCEIPIVDPANEQLDATVNGATGNATAQALEAGNEAIAPVHDAVCPPASEILGQLPSAGGEEEDEEATEQATSEESQAASEDSEESEQTEQTEETASSATPASTVTDIPAMVPAAS